MAIAAGLNAALAVASFHKPAASVKTIAMSGERLPPGRSRPEDRERLVTRISSKLYRRFDGEPSS
jgi:hypothetical protein